MPNDFWSDMFKRQFSLRSFCLATFSSVILIALLAAEHHRLVWLAENELRALGTLSHGDVFVDRYPLATSSWPAFRSYDRVATIWLPGEDAIRKFIDIPIEDTFWYLEVVIIPDGMQETEMKQRLDFVLPARVDVVYWKRPGQPTKMDVVE